MVTGIYDLMGSPGVSLCSIFIVWANSVLPWVLSSSIPSSPQCNTEEKENQATCEREENSKEYTKCNCHVMVAVGCLGCSTKMWRSWRPIVHNAIVVYVGKVERRRLICNSLYVHCIKVACDITNHGYYVK